MMQDDLVWIVFWNCFMVFVTKFEWNLDYASLSGLWIWLVPCDSFPWSHSNRCCFVDIFTSSGFDVYLGYNEATIFSQCVILNRVGLSSTGINCNNDDSYRPVMICENDRAYFWTSKGLSFAAVFLVSVCAMCVSCVFASIVSTMMSSTDL